MADYQEFLDSIDRAAYHEGEWQWEEDGYTVTRTYNYTAPGCHDSCGVLLYTKDGKLARIEGDPLDPYANGKLCMRCLDMIEMVESDHRLKYPMKRAGERGENKWERITWDEAIDMIATYIKEEIDDKGLGRESILVGHGTGRNINWQVPFIAGACFRTANVGRHLLLRLVVLHAARLRRRRPLGRLPHRGRVRNAARPLCQPRMEEPRRLGGVGQRAAEVQRRRLLGPLAEHVRADGHEDHLHRPGAHVVGRPRRVLAAATSRHRLLHRARVAQRHHERGPHRPRVR